MKTLLTILLSLFSLFAMSQTSGYSFAKNYETGTNPSLNFSSVDGDVYISPSNDNKITIRFIAQKNKKLLDISMDELSKYYLISIEETENGLNFKARPKQKNNLKNWCDRISLDFEVFTPVQTTCNVSAVDGGLFLQGLIANQKCKTVDGDIKVKDIKGNTTIATVDGDVMAKNITGNVVAGTTDGALEIKNIIGDVRLKAVDGDIRFYDIKGEIRCRAIDGNIRGKLTELKAPCEYNTVDGDIHITLPDGVGFNVDMKGESLHSKFQDFDGTLDKKNIKGKVNGGGVAVKLSTRDGNINVSFE